MNDVENYVVRFKIVFALYATKETQTCKRGPGDNDRFCK